MKPQHFCRPPLAMKIARWWFDPKLGRVVKTIRGPLNSAEKAALSTYMDRDLIDDGKPFSLGGLTYPAREV